jgi:hypothetical protein
MRIVLLSLLLVLTSCVTEDAGVAAARMEAQDDASCQRLSAGKGAGAYQQCRQNLIGYRQQAQAQAQADSAARSQALATFGDALSGVGAAMRTNEPSAAAIDADTPRTTNCTSTRQLPNGSSGGMSCTTF